MADESDCETALREAVQAIRDASFPGIACYRGWPAPDRLDATLAAQGAIVTVCTRPGAFFRNTTRYLNRTVARRGTPTLTCVTAGDTATFGGTGGAGQAVGIQAGARSWVIRLGGADTPASVAASLAAIVPGASASGAVLTVPGLTLARIGADGGVSHTEATIEQQFAVAVWCALPADRDRIASAISAGLAATAFLPLPDGAGRIRPAGAMTTDKGQAAGLYRRDLYYTVEYNVSSGVAAPSVIFPGFALDGGQAVDPRQVMPGDILPVLATVPIQVQATSPAAAAPASAVSFVQSTPAPVWTITHTLGRDPVVQVLTLGGEVIEPGNISYPDPGTVVLRFSPPEAGTATLT